MKLGHSEKGRKGVYGLGSLWRIVWCMVIGVIGAVKVLLCVMVVLTDRTRDILIINSLGEMAEDLQKRVVFFTDVVASQDSIMQRGYESVGIKGGFEVFERVKPEDVARKATERALLMLKAKPAPAGNFTVV